MAFFGVKAFDSNNFANMTLVYKKFSIFIDIQGNRIVKQGIVIVVK